MLVSRRRPLRGSSWSPRSSFLIVKRRRLHLLKAAKVRLGRFRISLETRTIFTILMMSTAVGPIRGLVFGAFGEISEEARTLLCYAADTTAARTWVEDGATSQEHAAALLKNRLYRRWGIKTAREYARIKIDGLRLVGGNPDFTNPPGHGDDDARFYDRQQAYVHARGG